MSQVLRATTTIPHPIDPDLLAEVQEKLKNHLWSSGEAIDLDRVSFSKSTVVDDDRGEILWVQVTAEAPIVRMWW